jgi:hypothetical protein
LPLFRPPERLKLAESRFWTSEPDHIRSRRQLDFIRSKCRKYPGRRSRGLALRPPNSNSKPPSASQNFSDHPLSTGPGEPRDFRPSSGEIMNRRDGARGGGDAGRGELPGAGFTVPSTSRIRSRQQLEVAERGRAFGAPCRRRDRRPLPGMQLGRNDGPRSKPSRRKMEARELTPSDLLVSPFGRATGLDLRITPRRPILAARCAEWLSDTLRPLRRSVPEPRVYGLGYLGSERPSRMVGTGSAVSPLLISACLRRV